jgi:hypothetical protein
VNVGVIVFDGRKYKFFSEIPNGSVKFLKNGTFGNTDDWTRLKNLTLALVGRLPSD